MGDALHRLPPRPADRLAGRRQYLRFLYTQRVVNDSELLRRQIAALEAEIGAAERIAAVRPRVSVPAARKQAG